MDVVHGEDEGGAREREETAVEVSGQRTRGIAERARLGDTHRGPGLPMTLN